LNAVEMQKTMAVGMGELCTTRDPLVVLAAYGLGSCIGVSVYDPVARVGGLAHVMLPCSREVSSQKLSYRFADVAVPSLLERVQQLGAMRKRLICKIAGGAHMLALAGNSDGFKIGERNAEAVAEALGQCGIKPLATEVGGTRGRTMRLFVENGRVFVKTVGQMDLEL